MVAGGLSIIFRLAIINYKVTILNSRIAIIIFSYSLDFSEIITIFAEQKIEGLRPR